MSNIIKNIRQRAKKKGKHIIFPEGDDERVIEAADYLIDEEICDVTLFGETKAIQKVSTNKSIDVIDSAEPLPYLDELTEQLWQRREDKLNGREEAREFLNNRLYYAASMVEAGHLDGCVAGSLASTGDVIRSSIHCIGLKKDTRIISSCFLMALKNSRTLTYADCGVVPYPNAEQLADIAIDSARSHKILTGHEPVVAMLSFSTKGSAQHERVALVNKATNIAKKKEPNLNIDGELQFDAAFVPAVAQRKSPNSTVAGNANVFIFPNIDAGNIAYKITERLAGASATGPILQGLAKPMMDLSRGCSWQDIVNAACVAILMCKE